MKLNSDGVMPGLSKLAGVYITRKSSFSRSPGMEFLRIEKAAPAALAMMSSREKRCLPVNPSTVSPARHNSEREQRSRDLGSCGIGRVRPDPVRQDIGDDVGREGVPDLVHPAVARVASEPAFVDELEIGAAPIPIADADRDQGATDEGQFPAHGEQVVAQLVEGIERRRNGCGTLIPRANRFLPGRPRRFRLG